jgi:predicted amidohydrolase YtcJ
MTLAFTGGRILSMAPAVGEPEVLVVAGDRIVAAGGREILAAHPDATVHDLAGRTLLPGFIDAHNHLSLAALEPLWADLAEVRSVDEAERALRAQAAREPDAGWIRGAGWERSGEPLPLTRHDLDAAGLDRPIVVAHFSLHQAVVCSRALDVLGIGRDTPDPQGGEIARGADGLPTGLLVERAWSAAHAASTAAYRDPDRWADLFAARARLLVADGITAVHDAACSPTAEAVYRSMAAAGTLPLSVLALPHPEALLRAPDAGRLEGPPTGDGDERFRVGPVKLFADGGIAPAFSLTVGGQRLDFGHAFDDLAGGMRAAVERGFGVAVHAMGNVGLARAIDAFERVVRWADRDHRFRLEHATLASRTQLARLRDLGAVAIVQPGFVQTMGDAVVPLAGPEATWLPFRDMLDLGLPMAASSDDPCAFHEPLRTALAGATRRTARGPLLEPAQAVDYETWLRAYTAGAAIAGRQEAERGTLTPGTRADLVVLDGRLDPSDPPRVSETWIGGARVHAAAP